MAREKGRKLHSPHFLILVAERLEGPSRLGITASRKVGGAVQRNRIKRMVREFFRLNLNSLPLRADISIIARKGAANLEFSQVCNELGLLRRTEKN